MHIKRETKAISSLILTLIILCSVIFGALVSYMWVIANYYNMPENTSLLVVEDVQFSVADFTHFNVTILNPSNSVIDVNITTLLLRVETRDELYAVPEAEPAIPFVINRGTRQSFKCMINWSNMTGQVIRVEPVAGNASTRSFPYALPYVSLTATPNFDHTESVDYFNLTLQNAQQSTANLTISEIRILSDSINATTPSLPHVLQPNDTQVFRCDRNWDNLRGQNVTITVKTTEGYELDLTTGKLLGAALNIADIKFDYSDSTYFNLTISSSEDSTAAAIINEVNLTLADGTTMTLNTIPPLHIIPIPIPPNQSLTIKCLGWDWNMSRNETITVTVYTKQGFTAPSKTVRTPPAIVWNITDAKFDLDDVEHFTVNATNMPCSLNGINVTGILLNGTATMDRQFLVLNPGEQGVINCTFDWTNFRGADANITAITQDGLNASITVTVPSVNLTIAPFAFFDNSTIIPYVNITISNAAFSSQNATIKQITFTVGNVTYVIDGGLTTPSFVPSGYVLTVGASATVVCPWNWTLYRDQSVTVTVQTQEGANASQTFTIP